VITPSAPGALVISLDFELHWGVRDHVRPGSTRYESIPVGRDRVRELTREFVDRGIRATWATVGFLFASTRQELEAVSPTERPGYVRREFDPYLEPVGADEDEDPSHLAGSLVRFLADSPGQEVASHTFSHFYCLEEGQTEAAFRADLAAAQAIATNQGLRLTSLVFPRNQWNPEYDAAVLDAGFTCVRPPQESWGSEARVASRQTPFRRPTACVRSRRVRSSGLTAGADAPPTRCDCLVCGEDCAMPLSEDGFSISGGIPRTSFSNRGRTSTSSDECWTSFRNCLTVTACCRSRWKTYQGPSLWIAEMSERAKRRFLDYPLEPSGEPPAHRTA
jgi:hypothetical protein